MKKYAKRAITSDECDTLDEAQGLIQENSDRTCDLSERLAAVEARTIQVGDSVTIVEGDKKYTGVVAFTYNDGLFDVDFPDGDDGCYGPEDLV